MSSLVVVRIAPHRHRWTARAGGWVRTGFGETDARARALGGGALAELEARAPRKSSAKDRFTVTFAGPIYRGKREAWEAAAKAEGKTLPEWIAGLANGEL